MGRMRRFTAAVITSAVIVSGAGAAAAGALIVHQPEVNGAGATIKIAAVSVFAPAQCLGEDGQSYVTYRGAFAGPETDTMPGATDYSLSGALRVTHAVWTVNNTTGRGVFRGEATLFNPISPGTVPAVTYSGEITLITQAPVPVTGIRRLPPIGIARGWINAATYTAGKPDGGSLLANVQMSFGPGLTATGEFGGSSGTSDMSAITDNFAC